MKKKVPLYIALLFIGGVIFSHYFPQRTHYEARFPIDFVPYSNQPRTEVKIEGNGYPLMVDLGSDSRITLKTEILDKIQKIPHRNIQSFDIKGNEYNSKVYLLPEIKIRNMTLTKIEVIDEGFDFLAKGSVLYDGAHQSKPATNLEKPGRIGRKLFTDINANLFLDFHNSVMFACCHLSDRKKNGYRINQFVSAPFELSNKEGIVLKMDTDLGIKRFMLDTGATKSLLNSSPSKHPDAKEWKPGLYQYHSTKFAFGGKDFGSIDLLLVEMKSFFQDLDGVIGMDFLKNHIVYIDFDQKRIHLAKSDACFPDQELTSAKSSSDLDN